MDIKIFNLFINEYKEIFYKYYFDENDMHSKIIFKDILNNRINNYIDFINISLIKKYLDKYYNNKKIRILDLGCGALDKAFILRKIFPNAEIYGVESEISDDSDHEEVNKTRFIKPHFFQVLKRDYNINFNLYDGRNLPFLKNISIS